MCLVLADYTGRLPVLVDDGGRGILPTNSKLFGHSHGFDGDLHNDDEATGASMQHLAKMVRMPYSQPFSAQTTAPASMHTPSITSIWRVFAARVGSTVKAVRLPSPRFARSLLPFLAVVLVENKEIYTTYTMAVGIDHEQLLHHANMLIQFIIVDRRGAMISQQDMVAALDGALRAANKMGELEATITPNIHSLSDNVVYIAYLVRGMCSHIRISFDNATDVGKHPLAPLLTRMVVQDQRIQRRDVRAPRLSPFVQFREPASPAEDESDGDEEPTTVSFFYNPSVRKAFMLMSDGSEHAADSYSESWFGMVPAHWLCPKKELELDVPNEFLQSGVIVEVANMMPPKPKKKRKRKTTSITKSKATAKAKPKATSPPEGKATSPPEVIAVASAKPKATSPPKVIADADGDMKASFEDPFVHETEVWFRTVAELDGWTVTVNRGPSSIRDKAPIVQVTNTRMADRPSTAREVCDAIKDSLPLAMDSITIPDGKISKAKAFLI